MNISIKISPGEKSKALLASEAAYELAQSLEGEISEFQKGSDIACLNREAGKAYCPLKPATLELLEKALELSRRTDRAFDIRFSSLNSKAATAPILLDRENSQAMLSDPNTRIGVASMGKGFIVDKMIESLRERGFGQTLIDAGGDLRALGGPWRVAIQIPGAAPGKATMQQNLSDRAWGSSGIYEQGHHIVDPRSMERVDRAGSVTIEGDNLTQAGALGTACFVLGEKKCASTLEKFPGYKMYWVYPDARVRIYP